MRTVLREVRAALGADAVILSTRNVDHGVEVIAAIDYDDSLIGRWADGSDQRDGAAIDGRARPGRDEAADPSPGPGRSPTATYASIAAAAAGQATGADTEPDRDDDRVEISPQSSAEAQSQRPDDPVTAAGARQAVATGSRRPALQQADAGMSPALAAEISDLRELLERQLSSLAWNDANRHSPAHARTLRQFAKLGLDTQVAGRLAARLPRSRAGDRTWRMPLQLLAERLPLAKRDLIDLQGVFAFIGPTGVGKTTTIAKIAARFALRHGVEHLGLVTTDGYRIGARDQLMTFARILGTPMHVADDAGEMRAVLSSLAHKRLILVDTAGMGQRDARLTQQFAALAGADAGIRTVLTLSAAADLGCLRDALRAFGAAAPVGLVTTKIDEAVSLGPILSLILESGLPLAYLCDGQRVPEDLHLASHRRAWIIRTAMEFARSRPPVGGEDELASAYGSMGLAANG
jgi:flagellar biosynthesis protein FlhF